MKKYIINIMLCLVVMFSVCLTDAAPGDKIFVCVIFGFIILFWIMALHDYQELQKQLRDMGYPEDNFIRDQEEK